MSEVKSIIDKIKKFRDERDWMQFHDSKKYPVEKSKGRHAKSNKL